MKSLVSYILESGEDIKFTIWEEPGKKVQKLNRDHFNKIEYQYKSIEKGIYISFLLGLEDDKWKLWVGPLGKASYNKKYFYDFDTTDFNKSLLSSKTIINDFIETVQNNPLKYIMYYKNK